MSVGKLRVWCLVLCVVLLTSSISWSQQKNIIFILTDDLGWTDISVPSVNFGNQSDFYQTPNLEQLASQGMSFTNAYTCGANCAPTRGAIFTGQYAVRSTNDIFNVDNLNRGNNANNSTLIGPAQGLPNGQDQLAAEAFTVAEMLNTANYATAHFGKFHVGTGSGTNSVINQGFDQNFGGNGNGAPGSYFSNGSNFGGSIGPGLDPYASDYTSAQSQALTGSEVLTGTRKHVTDAITEACLDFITQSQSSAGSPFFLHVGHYAVHTPVNGSGRPDLVAKYNALPDGQFHDNSHYAALVEGIDQSIGQLVEFLTATPDVNNPGQMLSETTLLIYYSDNGGSEGPTENSPLRSEKGEYREGGIRVPMIAWLPGVVPANTINDTPVVSVDFMQTFAEIAGVDLASVLPMGYEPLDGESIYPILLDPNAQLSRDSVFWHFPGYLIGGGRNQRPQSIIRKGDLKLVFSYEPRTYELYDVVNDIGESSDLALNPQFESTAIAMSIELRDFLMDSRAKLPTYRDTGETVAYPDVFELPAPSVWDGGNGNFTDSNWDGGQSHPGVVLDGSIELNGDVVQILDGTVATANLRLRTVGGFFDVDDATLTCTSSANLSGADFGATSSSTGATTANFTHSMVSVRGSGTSGRSLYVRNSSALNFDGGSLTILHTSADATRAAIEIESSGVMNVTGGTSISTEVLRIDNSGVGFNFESGNLQLNNAHPLRSSSGFNGQFNFTGAAGDGTIFHNDLSEANVVRHLAGRVTAGFFAIDGVTVEPNLDYNGSNIAAINSELETLAVNNRYLQLVEAGGTQVLSLVSDVLLGDVNLDGDVNLLDVSPFINLLTESQFQVEADINGDGVVDLLDVEPFVKLLSGG